MLGLDKVLERHVVVSRQRYSVIKNGFNFLDIGVQLDAEIAFKLDAFLFYFNVGSAIIQEALSGKKRR